MSAGLQRSSSTRADRLVWYFGIGVVCSAITIGDDFALPEWRGRTAGFGGRMYDPAGPVREAHWDLMAIRYPEVPHPGGPYRREEWDIASEEEAEPTFLRYVHELESVTLPDIESGAGLEAMVLRWERLQSEGSKLHTGEVEWLRIGREILAKSSS
jgi:hypothetical protein